MKKYQLTYLIIALAGLWGCEANNPFNTGPAYDVEANLAIDRPKIEAYLQSAEIDSLYRIHDPSGVVVIVQEEGEGSRPTVNTIVHTDYTGSLLSDGSVFDTSIEAVAKENDLHTETSTYGPISFRLGAASVIPGWEIAFQKLRPRSKALLIIPSTQAYRTNESARIPANSILIFEVDFRGID